MYDNLRKKKYNTVVNGIIFLDSLVSSHKLHGAHCDDFSLVHVTVIACYVGHH